MEETKYTIIGKVEIGTDEYRDLITKNVQLEQDLSQKRSEYWELTKERDNLKGSKGKIDIELELFTAFLKEKELSKEFSLWKFEKENKKTSEDED